MLLDRKIKFVIPGKAVGHTATTYNSKFKSKAYAKYMKYAKEVRMYAELAGVPLPLAATVKHQIVVSVVCYFENGHHPDTENVRKGVADALAYNTDKRRKGDDKQYGGAFTPPRYDKENPRVIVTVKPYKKKKKKGKKK